MNSLYPQLLKKFQAYCYYPSPSVRPSVKSYFLKLLLHFINRQTELLRFDLGCHVVFLERFNEFSVSPGGSNNL